MGLRENQYDGGSLQDPYEHLSIFYESCLFCCPDGVTEDQKKLRLFALTLVGRSKEWLFNHNKGFGLFVRKCDFRVKVVLIIFGK